MRSLLNIKDGAVTGKDVKNSSLGTNMLSPTAVSWEIGITNQSNAPRPPTTTPG